MADSNSWKAIFDYKNIYSHNFDNGPYILIAKDIKDACQNFKETSQKEVRILCKQDSREDRPNVFVRNNLFILPKKNGSYYIIKGDGYVDISDIVTPIQDYISKLDFDLISSTVGNSEMQYLDFAYANSLIRTFMEDPSLVLTIRGRKYTPSFSFTVNGFNLDVEGVQTEVDAGYEGKNSLVLVEAKNSKTKNININKIKTFNCMKLTGNKRRRQSKNAQIEDAEENAKKEFDSFFNDKMRQKEKQKEEKIGLNYIKEKCKDIFYNIKKNNKENNKNEKKLEENNKDNKDNKDTNTFYDLIKDNWEKEISILDIVFLKYLKECSSLTNKNYFYFIVQFIVSLRNYLQEKKIKGKNRRKKRKGTFCKFKII